MVRKKNKNKILIYLILGLLAIIVVGVIIFLVNRNNNNNNTKITKSENTPAVPSNNLPEIISSANIDVSCPSNEYYDYDTNQCTSLKSANSNCKNGVACASGVCVIREEESFKKVTSGPKAVSDVYITNADECKAAATALNKTWGGSLQNSSVVSGCYLMQNLPSLPQSNNKIYFNTTNTQEPCSNDYQCIQKEKIVSGKCGGNQLSKNCIEMDPTDTDKCKTCYNLTLNLTDILYFICSKIS